MNRFNPQKLLGSKWTAVKPQLREKHFIVIGLERDEMDRVTGCELQAVINHKSYCIDWLLLRDTDNWMMGWK